MITIDADSKAMPDSVKSPRSYPTRTLPRLVGFLFILGLGLGLRTVYIRGPETNPDVAPKGADSGHPVDPVSSTDEKTQDDTKSHARMADRPAAHFLARLPSVPLTSPSGAASYSGDSRIVEFEVVEGGLAVAFGDLILGKVEDGATSKHGRTELAAPLLWDKPEIPYLIGSDLPNPARVEKAIEYFNLHTPVKFVAYAGQTDALVFEPGEEHCYSALGRTGGLQPIRLAGGCHAQEIMHEMMHALGFVHEQSRPDRDQNISVQWDNIEARFFPQFALAPDLLMEAERDTAFDFRSIMLYRPDTFAARPGLVTIKPQEGRPAIDPTSQGLSEGDVQRLARLYRIQ